MFLQVSLFATLPLQNEPLPEIGSRWDFPSLDPEESAFSYGLPLFYKAVLLCFSKCTPLTRWRQFYLSCSCLEIHLFLRL